MANPILNLDAFETVFFHKCLTDDKFLASVIDYTDKKYLKDNDFRFVFEIINTFYQKHNHIPTSTEVLNYCNTQAEKDHLKNTLLKIQKVDKNLNENELYNNAEQFLREKAVYHTMLDVVDKVNASGVNTAEILQQFEKSCNINLSINLGLDLHTNFDVVVKDLETEQPVIPSGWKWLDKHLDGGFLAKGRALYVVVGATNVGKSIVLGNIATNIAKQGKTVLLISLEMSELMYARRLSANISTIPISTLRFNTQTLKDNIKQFFNKSGGCILIKEFPPSTITPNQLSAYLTKVKQKGIHFDAIVLDYLNLIHSPIGNNSYERVKYVTEQIRALTYKFNVPIISATQLNRTGYDVSNPGLETVGESLGLAMTADAMMSIWQEEEDKALNIMRMGMMKNRFGANEVSTQLKIDYPTLTITEEEEMTIESAAERTLNALDLLKG